MGQFISVLIVFVFVAISAGIKSFGSPQDKGKFQSASRTETKADSVSNFTRAKVRGLQEQVQKLDKMFSEDDENEELEEKRQALQKASARAYEIDSSGKIKTRSKKIKSSAKVKSSELALAMEDRKHDWLAQQLAEERAVLRRGSLVDLGASHDRTCDARAVKRLHELQHDDSIDEGEIG